jgi:MraZ protein
MFLGQYEHTIDDKGRMIIPARFRDLIADGAFITQGFEHNLMVLTASSFQQISDRINRMSMTDPTARQLRRLLYSHADRLEVDRAGRILIPAFLREAAELTSNAFVVGVGDHFEIWSPEWWGKQDVLLQDSDANAQRFAALDLSPQ